MLTEHVAFSVVVQLMSNAGLFTVVLTGGVARVTTGAVRSLTWTLPLDIVTVPSGPVMVARIVMYPFSHPALGAGMLIVFLDSLTFIVVVPITLAFAVTNVLQ